MLAATPVLPMGVEEEVEKVKQNMLAKSDVSPDDPSILVAPRLYS